MIRRVRHPGWRRGLARITARTGAAGLSVGRAPGLVGLAGSSRGARIADFDLQVQAALSNRCNPVSASRGRRYCGAAASICNGTRAGSFERDHHAE